MNKQRVKNLEQTLKAQGSDEPSWLIEYEPDEDLDRLIKERRRAGAKFFVLLPRKGSIGTSFNELEKRETPVKSDGSL